MKKLIAVFFSSCLLSVGLQAHMDSNTPENSSQMMNMQVDAVLSHVQQFKVCVNLNKKP